MNLNRSLNKEIILSIFSMGKKSNKQIILSKIIRQIKQFLIFQELLSILHMVTYTKRFMRSFIMMFKSNFQIKKEKSKLKNTPTFENSLNTFTFTLTEQVTMQDKSKLLKIKKNFPLTLLFILTDFYKNTKLNHQQILPL